MDDRLRQRLRTWNDQLVLLAAIERECFQLEATEKALEGRLFLQAMGKTVEERKAQAYASTDWQDFKTGLATARAHYHNHRRLLELRIKAYEAEYCTYKIEAEMIHKGKGGL